MRTPTRVSLLPEIEKFGCLKTSAPVSVIPVEEEDWLFDNSYSSVH